jgi:hypothetical protein
MALSPSFRRAAERRETGIQMPYAKSVSGFRVRRFAPPRIDEIVKSPSGERENL